MSLIMHVWADADACPAVIKDILFRAAERTQRSMTLVVNKMLRTPPCKFMRALQVPRCIHVVGMRSTRAGSSIRPRPSRSGWH